MRAFDRDVRVRTETYALDAIQVYGRLPVYPAHGYDVAQIIGKQMLRSATSVGANFAESTRAQSKADKSAIQNICLKELQETRYWFRLLIRAEIGPETRLTGLMAETDELIALFVASIRTLRNG